jgi:hypothetical protein
MLPEVSMTSITVASSTGVINTVCGLANEIHSSNKPKPSKMGGLFFVFRT